MAHYSDNGGHGKGKEEEVQSILRTNIKRSKP